MPIQIPSTLSVPFEAHCKWLEIVKNAQRIVDEDLDMQTKAALGLRIKERRFPPEVLGRTYAQYCSLINRIYDAFLNNIQLQRAPYLLEIVSVLMKRLYELRNEIVHLIVNDYIYIDSALIQLGMVPSDIELIVPYHLPLKSRSVKMEQLLQKMFAGAVNRKMEPKHLKPETLAVNVFDGDEQEVESTVNREVDVSEESVRTVIREELINSLLIQKYERYRQYFIADFRGKCARRKLYFTDRTDQNPMNIKIVAARLIQKVYRKFMEAKRNRVLEQKRDILLGLTPDPFKRRMSFEEENHKIYERRREIREDIQVSYMKEVERENLRLMVYKKDNQIDDITEQVREWFKEWYYGYGFFPEYPYDSEGGTIMVIREDYPSIEEKVIEDEKLAAATKGKTKEQIQHEKEQAKLDAEMKAELEREQMKKEEEQLLKSRCNPQSDPGYKVQSSEVMSNLTEVLQKYRVAWSIYDNLPLDKCGDNIYGYIKDLITEDLMLQLHKDCRVYVDDLMRLDLKLLIKMHQIMYKNVGWKYPKQIPRKKPKILSVPKPFVFNDDFLKRFEKLFDLSIISKPTFKIKDIYGDSNYAAYELNVTDPDAKFPLPSYGDIRRRLVLSCVMGCGVQPGAKRNKAVMLTGPERNGKSFLVDCVAGELGAIKIDITPEVFTSVVKKPAQLLTEVLTAARVFQPAVIFMRNVERVFARKVSLQDKWLKAKSLKKALPKMLRTLLVEDKIIFIATCSYPNTAQRKPLVSMFNELILVPRADYGSIGMFLRTKFVSIRSMPRNYCVQPLAQVTQGYGFGVIIQLFEEVMNSERIIRLNVNPLSPGEFIEKLIEMGLEATTLEDYQEYVDFFLESSPLSRERQEYEMINRYRANAYQKLAKKKAENQN